MAIDSEAVVAGLAKDLADARVTISFQGGGLEEALTAIRKRFTYRIQDLGRLTAAVYEMGQPNTLQSGAAVGGSEYELDRGGRRGGKNDFRLYWPKCGPRWYGGGS